jgi:hypothetical protein
MTAVEWLEELWYKSAGKLYREDFEKALAMEKEQIMMAFNDGKVNSVLKKRGSEEYYQETYSKKEE